MDGIQAPHKLGRREAYALIAAEAQLLEGYRGQLERELNSVNGRIRVLGMHYPAAADNSSGERRLEVVR